MSCDVLVWLLAKAMWVGLHTCRLIWSWLTSASRKRANISDAWPLPSRKFPMSVEHQLGILMLCMSKAFKALVKNLLFLRLMANFLPEHADFHLLLLHAKWLEHFNDGNLIPSWSFIARSHSNLMHNHLHMQQPGYAQHLFKG